MSENREEEFLERTNKDGVGGCWLWTGGTFASGYGVFYVGGKNKRAHRVSWEIHYGTIPMRKHVLHTCDVKSCVNPGHLYLGTDQDNMNDKVQRGRQAKGADNGNSKLSEEQVKEIRRLYSTGNYSQKRLGNRYSVSPTHISLIINHEVWAHTTETIEVKE